MMRTDLAAYVLPFAVFMLLTWAEGTPALAEYYPFVYTAKVAVVAGLCWWYLGRYPRFSTAGFGLAAVAGVIGVVLWVVLAAIPIQSLLPEPLHSWVGGTRAAYRPLEAISSRPLAWLFLAIRFAGLALVVPVMEEVFWRGFLLRYLMDEDFTRVPIGKVTANSVAIVTVLFTLTHPEVLAAVVWGAGIHYVYWKTANLWACVLTHSVTNLLLGVYIVITGQWNLW